MVKTMRLIDADDVIETISHYLGKKLYATYPNDKMPDFDKGVIDGYARARSIVFETPTIDPHVKHGRWIPINDQVAKCSSCGMLETTHGKDKTGQALIHKATKHYCPSCGAKMDEEG